MKCSTCGRELLPAAKFCGGCGAPVTAAPSSDAQTAALEAPRPQERWDQDGSWAPQPAGAASQAPGDARAAGVNGPTVQVRNPVADTQPSHSPATPAPHAATSVAGPTPLVLLGLAVGGLALIIQASALTYAFVDDYSSAKPMLVLLLALGLASAGTALGLSKARAQSALRADGPITNVLVAFVLGMTAVAYGTLELLTVLGS